MTNVTNTILPTNQDVRQAREFHALLAPLVTPEGTAQLHLDGNNQPTELTLPALITRVLLSILQEMEKGNGVSITPIQKEFTIQQAADFLMISRPYLIEELLEKNVLPCRKVGNRRRIRAEDLIRYKEAEEKEITRRENVMQELMAETERLGLYK